MHLTEGYYLEHVTLNKKSKNFSKNLVQNYAESFRNKKHSWLRNILFKFNYFKI